MKFERASGVLLHPTSLPGPYGIGEMGPEADRFADFLAETLPALVNNILFRIGGQLTDKTSGVDHQNDASGYPIAYELPVVRPVLHIPMSFI